MIVSKSPISDLGMLLERAVVAPLFSAVTFRESEENGVFKEVERRLCRRDPVRFIGYAASRLGANGCAPSIQERVAATAVADLRWSGLERVLYSVELEVWMDLSRAETDPMAVYEACIDQAIPFYVRHSGPFTPLFGRLLLQKNGFERVSEGPVPEGAAELEALLNRTA